MPKTPLILLGAAALAAAVVTIPVEAQNGPKSASASATVRVAGEEPRKPATPAAAPTPRREWPVRESFRSVVITGLPKVFSNDFEKIAARLSTLAGTELQPSWWRLDMAAFTTKTPIKAAELATKLGLTVISDVGDDLILAPEDSAQARQAEARVYMLKLFSRHAGIWKQEAHASQPSRAGGGLAMARIIAMPGVRPAIGLGGGAVGAPKPDAKPVTQETAADLFSLKGPLSDEKVLNALGLTKAEVDLPLKHYDLQSFRVGPYMPLSEMRNGRRMISRKYYYDGRSEDEGNQMIAITAESGFQQSYLPTGPELNLDISSGLMMAMGPMMWQLQRAMRFAGRDYYTSNSYEEGTAEQIQENAQFACLLLDDLQPTSKPDTAAIEKCKADLEALRKAEAKPEEILAARLKLARAEGCNLAPRRLVWGDVTANDQRGDIADDMAPTNAAKLRIAKLASEAFVKYAKEKGAAAKWPEGALGDYNLRNEYGFDWGAFDVPPYDDDGLALTQVKDPGVKNQMQVATKPDSTTDESRQFSFRVDTETGTVFWLSGEPESAEVILARRKEVYDCVGVLEKAVQAEVKAGTPDMVRGSDWIKAQLSKTGPKDLKHVSSLDFRVARLGPGILRVSGEAATRDSRQSVVTDTTNGRSVWETLPPTAVKDIEPEEYDMFDK